MNSSTLIKTATLLSFAILVTSFIAYRAGAFEKIFNKKSIRVTQKESLDETIPLDSPVVKAVVDSSAVNVAVDSPLISPTMMSTSKSMILIDDKYKFIPIDTTKKRSTIKLEYSEKKVLKKTTIMGGSKSAIIYKPALDTTTLKIKK